MTQTLFLHVGYGRCGTTAIQDLGAERRDELRARGLLYLRPSDLGLDTQYDRGGNGRALAGADDPLAVADRMAEHVAGDGAPLALISAEQLNGARDATLAHLVGRLRDRGIRAVAVVYVREQREWLVSRWGQGLRTQRWQMPLDQYLREYVDRGFREPVLDYGARCRRLAAIFGRDDLVVRRFSRTALSGGDLRLDLLGLMGVDPSDLIADGSPTNPSPFLEQAVLLRIATAATRITDLFDPRAFLRYTSRLYARRGWPRRTEVYRLAQPATLRLVAEHYAPLNEAFRAEFLPDVPAPVLPSSLPDEWEPLTEDECLDAPAVAAFGEYLCYAAGRRLTAAR